MVGFFIFGLLAILGSAIDTLAKSAGSGNNTDVFHNIEERVVVKGSAKKIVHIDLEGVIFNASSGSQPSMVEEFQQQMRKAVADDAVVAIVVRINSPGGEVTASDLLHRTMQKADIHKPVIAYLDSIAASGGYYMACGARHIMAHETTLTGSIGVIIQSPNYRELLQKVGVSMEVYKSGKFKDILSGSREATPEEREYIQAMERQSYERFSGVVSASRKKPVDELRDSSVADGRIFSGKDALASGMIDSTGFIDDAYTAAIKESGVEGASVVRYRPQHGLLGALGLFGQASAKSSNRIEIDVSERLLPKLQPGVAYYLHLP